MLGLGLALPTMNQRGGSGVAAFTPAALHVDQAVGSFGRSSALTAAGTTVTGGSTGVIADSATATMSYWIRGVSLSNTVTDRLQTSSFTDIMSGFDATSSETTPGFNTIIDNANSVPGTFRFNMSDAAGSSFNYAGTVIDTAEWQHVLMSFDGTPAGTSKYAALYINGVKQGTGGVTSVTSGNALLGFTNTGGWNISWPYAQSGQFDLAECFLDTTVSIVDSSNNISAANIAKFYSGGKPVNLGTKGQTPLGRTPEIYISGPAAGIVNKGTVVGLTAAGLYDAPYGPGGPPANQAYVSHIYGDALVSTSTSQTTPNIASNVKAGDLILQFWATTDLSAGVNHAPVTPAGYTVVDSQPSVGTNANQSSVLVYKLAAVDGESTSVTWTWTTGISTRLGDVRTIIVKGVNQTTPINAHAVAIDGQNSNVTAFVSPSVTTTATNTLRLTIYYVYSTQTMSVPTGTARYHTTGRVTVNYDVLAAAALAAGVTSNGAGNAAHAYTVAIAHA